MLTGIDHLLRGPLLSALDLMGHGDMVVIADANFPARRLGPAVFDLPGTTAAEATAAILSVFPLDPTEPVTLMTPPVARPAVQVELAEAVLRVAEVSMVEVGRFEFYELAREASIIVSTGETRPFGNLIARKGGINS
ncbi:MAG: RbsD or FucU transport [Glaciihabitans sp.]|jgi:L-fucose mutarotase|nr:RbsD or FucU transport [Glaciihabitans sp.]MDQ1569461.1 L-fucose mutarotase [Actinomycetota bacterium]